jgi:peroxiredoxin
MAIAPALALLSLSAQEIPRKAPELAVQLPDGQQLLLSQFRGKVVLLEFVHTTCPHCQQSSAFLERLTKELGPKGFQPIAVAFNDNAAQLVPDFIRQMGLTFPVGVPAGANPREIVLTYLQHSMLKTLYVPQMVFIDRKGIIRAQHGGDDDFFQKLEDNVRNELETLLKEPGPAHRARAVAPAKSQSAVKKTASATP